MRRRVFMGAVAGLALAGVVAPIAASPAMAADSTTGSISGTVFDTRGHALVDSQIMLNPVTDGDWTIAHTDVHGKFKLSGVTAGDYRVQVGADGWNDYAPGRRSWETAGIYTVGGGHDTVVTSVVNVAGFVSGKVVDPTGKPAAGIAVGATDLTGPYIYNGTTAADGTYKIKVRPDGDYELQFVDGLVYQYSPSGTTDESQSVKYAVTPGHITRIPKQKLVVAPKLSGRLTDAAGAPVAGATVTWAWGQGSGMGESTTTDADGRYSFAKVAAGTVQLTFAAPDGQTQYAHGHVNPWEADNFDTTPGQTTVVDEQLLPVS